MPKDFELRDVIEHAGVTRNQLVRWTDAEIIQPAIAGEGKGSRRRFSLRNIVEAVVCDRLSRLGATEGALRTAVESMNYTWNAWPIETMWSLQKHVLWMRIAGTHHVRRYDSRIDAPKVTEGRLNRAAPLVNLVSAFDVVGDINQGYFGIALPLVEIIQDLQEKTGEKLA